MFILAWIGAIVAYKVRRIDERYGAQLGNAQGPVDVAITERSAAAQPLVAGPSSDLR